MGIMKKLLFIILFVSIPLFAFANVRNIIKNTVIDVVREAINPYEEEVSVLEGDVLLLEIGDYFLLESGDKLLLE